MLTTTIAGRTWNFSHSIGRNAGTGNGFSYPTAVVPAPDDQVLVLNKGQQHFTDSPVNDRRVNRWSLDEEYLSEFGHAQLIWPSGLALDQENRVYCSEEYKHRIFIYNLDGELLKEWGEAGIQPGQLNGPSGLAFDDSDDLFVTDSLSDRVQKFTNDGNYISSWGDSGTGPGQFDRPWGITTDGNGDVYVVDWGNNRVQKFDPNGNYLLAFGSFNGDGGDLDHPSDVAVDSDGDVYVTDWGNKRVQIYDPEGDIITALWGDATQFSKSAQGVMDANPDAVKAYRRVEDLRPLGKFERPRGIAIDNKNRIIVTECTRGRLQIYQKEVGYSDPQFNL